MNVKPCIQQEMIIILPEIEKSVVQEGEESMNTAQEQVSDDVVNVNQKQRYHTHTRKTPKDLQ